MDHCEKPASIPQPSFTAEQLIFLARTSEQVERHEEQLDYMKQFARLGYPFSQLEKSLLNAALKTQLYYFQKPNRRLQPLYYREKYLNSPHAKLLQSMIDKVNRDVINFCNETIELIDDHVLKSCDDDPELKVFFFKLKGDYYKELASYSKDKMRQDYIEKGLQAYKEGMVISKAELSSTNGDRLALMLNIATFYYESICDVKNACAIAQEAFDEGMRDIDLDNLGDNGISTTFLQLLRDNITLWKSDEEEL